jgi:hypothetical protein
MNPAPPPASSRAPAEPGAATRPPTVHARWPGAFMTAAGQWLAVAHDGAEVRTADGLAAGEALHPVQQAFIDHDAFQCGYCTPGQIYSAVGMLQEAKRGWPSHVTADLAGDPELTDAAARGGHLSAASQKPGERDGGGPAAAGSAVGVLAAAAGPAPGAWNLRACWQPTSCQHWPATYSTSAPDKAPA